MDGTQSPQPPPSSPPASASAAPSQASGSSDPDVPWQQRLFDNIWLLAIAALLYFFLSYALWGLIDLARVPAAGG